MGFPLSYTEIYLPKLFTCTLSLLGFIRATILSVLDFLGISRFLEPEPQFPTNKTHITSEPPVSAILIREILPVIKFADLPSAANASELGQPPESFAVCLDEFEGGDDIRCLINCKHIFHRSCLDRWMDHDKNTCPLCIKHFVPSHFLEEFNKRLWEAYCIYPDFYREAPTNTSSSRHFSSPLFSFLAIIAIVGIAYREFRRYQFASSVALPS